DGRGVCAEDVTEAGWRALIGDGAAAGVVPQAVSGPHIVQLQEALLQACFSPGGAQREGDNTGSDDRNQRQCNGADDFYLSLRHRVSLTRSTGEFLGAEISKREEGSPSCPGC